MVSCISNFDQYFNILILFFIFLALISFHLILYVLFIFTLQLDKKYIESNLYLCHIFDIYQFHYFSFVYYNLLRIILKLRLSYDLSTSSFQNLSILYWISDSRFTTENIFHRAYVESEYVQSCELGGLKNASQGWCLTRSSGASHASPRGS